MDNFGHKDKNLVGNQNSHSSVLKSWNFLVTVERNSPFERDVGQMSRYFRKAHFRAAQQLVIANFSELGVSLQVEVEPPKNFTFVVLVLYNGFFIHYHLLIHSASARGSWLCARHHPSSWGPRNDDDLVCPSCGVPLEHFSYFWSELPPSWSCQEEALIPQRRH